MDKDLARHVARVGFSTMNQLSHLLELLKDQCDPEEYQTYLKAIGTVGASISTEMISRVVALYPELEVEIEAKIKKYGLVI